MIRIASLELLSRSGRAARHALTVATASLGIASLVLTTACYTYEVRSSADVPSGQRVVVALNNRGRVAMAPEIGDDADALEGNFVSASADSIRLQLTQATYLSGSSSTFGGVDVAVPLTGTTTISTKQFSRAKTSGVMAIAAAALVAAVKSFGLASLGGSGKEGKPSEPPATQ